MLLSPQEAQKRDLLIKEAMGTCLNLNPLFNKSETLIGTTYYVLTALYVQQIPYVLLSAPTGTGKSIIGDMIHFCSSYIDMKFADIDPLIDGRLARDNGHTYFLTSSKALQEQLEEDIERFSFHDYFSMLKGTGNYECTLLTKQTGEYTSYQERYCLGMKGDEKASLPCYDTCPYMVKRSQAAAASCTVLNYAYFLNVMKMRVRPYFDIRPLTICDEAHLVPDIVLGHFNIALTQYNMNRIYKIFSQVNFNFRNFAGSAYEEGKAIMLECFKFFQSPNPGIAEIIGYVNKYSEMISFLSKFGSDLGGKSSVFKEMFGKEIKKLAEDLKSMPSIEYIELLSKRPEDIFIESEFVAMSTLFDGTYKTFRHTMYDLSESEMCRNNFLSTVDRAVFMSATLGNIDEFAMLMGMKKGEYVGFRLASNFDFSKSPIYLTKSGFLNYAKFNENIGKVLSDCIKICEEFHPDEKGIIHTSTFDVGQKLREALSGSQAVRQRKSLWRYLFYTNSTEKEAAIKLMKTSDLPYIIIGPSLYEGIDLKYEQGRFNIIVKAPYSALTEYIQRKIKRYPFWYERNTLEKIVQGIGRTNRAVDDWSKTYLLDGSLEKLIFKTQPFITARVAYKYLN